MTHRLHCGHKLPFMVRCAASNLFGGGRVTLNVGLRADCPEAESEVLQVLSGFCRFGATGAMCGATLEAAQSDLRLVLATPQPRDHVLGRLMDCRLDDAALIVLCDLLLASPAKAHVNALVVDNGQTLETLRFLADVRNPYPALSRHLPFEFEDEEPEGGGLLFRIRLPRSATKGDMERVRQLCDLWSQTTLAGAYSLPPARPNENYLEPETLVVFDDTIEWPIGKLRADPACLFAFVNSLGALATQMPIRAVTISQ